MVKKVGTAVASGLFNKASLDMAQANKKFMTKQIPIEDIIPNGKNEYHTDNIDELALSIANDLGISSAQVGKYEYTDRNLVMEFKEELNKGTISMNTANDIAHLPAETQVDLFKKEKASEITAKKLRVL